MNRGDSSSSKKKAGRSPFPKDDNLPTTRFFPALNLPLNRAFVRPGGFTIVRSRSLSTIAGSWAILFAKSSGILSIDHAQLQNHTTPAAALNPHVKTTGALESHFIGIHTGINEFV